MESFTAGAIVKLVSQKFLESSAGELAKTFTPPAIAKIHQLWQIIKQRFQGNSRREQVLTSIENGSWSDLDRLILYLEDAMDENKEFAAQLQAIAREIKAGQRQENTTMTMNNRDNNTSYQFKEGTINTGNTYNTYNYSNTQPPDT